MITVTCDGGCGQAFDYESLRQFQREWPDDWERQRDSQGREAWLCSMCNRTFNRQLEAMRLERLAATGTG